MVALPLALLGAAALWVLSMSGKNDARNDGSAAATQGAEPGEYFTWRELTRSSTAEAQGLDNTPGPEQANALRALVQQVLDPIRRALGRAVRVTSGYRSDAVNNAVDGASSSQHVKGEAVDIKVDGIGAEQLARFIARSGVPFDQLIWYAPARGGHVHVSFTTRRENRGQTLHAPAAGGYRSWTP